MCDLDVPTMSLSRAELPGARTGAAGPGRASDPTDPVVPPARAPPAGIDAKQAKPWTGRSCGGSDLHTAHGHAHLNFTRRSPSGPRWGVASRVLG